MTDVSYRACPIRERKTRAEVEAVRTAIAAILKADHPQTVRRVFYQLVARGLIEKTEKEYQGTVIRLLTDMRIAGLVKWNWIIDQSRRTLQTRTFENVADALEHTAKFYRTSALHHCSNYIEIWCEKDALSGIISDEAGDYDVPVVVSKGMPSLTQVYGSFVKVYNADKVGKQSYVYQFGDHDPTGCLIVKAIEKRLNDFCDKHDVEYPVVERIALTEEQIRQHHLPTRPTKREGNSHARNFEGDSVELDALPSAELRSLVRECIERHISQHALEVLRAAEESEREDIWRLADGAAA